LLRLQKIRDSEEVYVLNVLREANQKIFVQQPFRFASLKILNRQFRNR